MSDMDMDMSVDVDSDCDLSVDVSDDCESIETIDDFGTDEGFVEPEYFTAEEFENHFESLGDDKEALSNYRDLLESGEIAVWEEEISEEVAEPEYFTAEELENHFESLGDDKEALSNYRELLESGEIAVWEEVPEEDDSVKVLTSGSEFENIVEGDLDVEDYESEDMEFAESVELEEISESVESEIEEEIQEQDEFEETTEQVEIADSESAEDLELEMEEIDYDEIYETIEQESLAEGFADIEIAQDAERLDSSLDCFNESNWENLSLAEQKESMETLADYVIDVVGLKNPPTIEYYNNAVEGDYGGFNASTNTLRVNEYMLYQSDEAVDTIAHEVWHAHQYECAASPQCVRDHQYRYNFENYISSEYGQEAYEGQLIEAEARAFAAQFKNRLSFIKGSIPVK